MAQKISEVAQFVENEYSLKVRTGSYLTISEVLFHLNIIDSENTTIFGFRNSNNELIHVELSAIASEMWEESNVSKAVLTVPEIKEPKNSASDLWFMPVSNTSSLYINFKNYPSFEEMQVFGEQLVMNIQENQYRLEKRSICINKS